VHFEQFGFLCDFVVSFIVRVDLAVDHKVDMPRVSPVLAKAEVASDSVALADFEAILHVEDGLLPVSLHCERACGY
jgi:hypothetical protein